ncbi:hypothetical protein E9531_07850 [Lampropedia puyangensis]|uniref:DNA gyrase subunit B n=1 Tax=Lampropedia puyangensis TaxID=1330072 RepID=A0A4S8F7J0_9BURK|nr:hypothetical protein E9531_07850 [Lampropedia puyangensis]
MLTLILYPLLVFTLIGHINASWLAGLLLLAATIKLLWQRSAMAWAVWLCALLITCATVWGGTERTLRYYPVAMNSAMLILFAASLKFPPSIVERIARLREPELPATAIAYTRTVTQVWCLFFIINGSIALATALWASHAVWAAYNGFIAYVLMALLGGCEWLIRQRIRAKHLQSA